MPRKPIAPSRPASRSIPSVDAGSDRGGGPHESRRSLTVLRGILTPRHPSQLYEALLEGIVLFVILWFVRTRFRTPNGVHHRFVLDRATPIFRIVVEYFREPDAPLIGMFTRGQFFSFFLIAIGIGVHRRGETAADLSAKAG